MRSIERRRLSTAYRIFIKVNIMLMILFGFYLVINDFAIIGVILILFGAGIIKI